MSLKDATLIEIYDAGWHRGHTIASWQEMPEMGSRPPKEIDWQGIDRVETVDAAGDVFCMTATAAEEHCRSFTPFEFTASELNSRDDREDAWERFEEGISKGILDNWELRKSYYE